MREGDYVGVALPMTNAIPMVGRASDNTLLLTSFSTNLTTLYSDSLIPAASSLHLYANIGKVTIGKNWQ